MTPIKIRKIQKGEEVKHDFLITQTSKSLLALNVVLALVYFAVIALWFPISNKILFYFLIAGEVFHLWQTLTYIYTVWNTEYMPRMDKTYTPGVDVFITVCGEPVDIVEETLVAAQAMDYPRFNVYILNDGYVAKKDNWREIELMAESHGATCLTRTTPGGAKAGNINHALTKSTNEYVAIFDADHVPHKDFLQKTMGYFIDPKMGFVQSPQFYKNYALNQVTLGAWQQQSLFFGPICKGKNRLNSATMCGTNMVISRKALKQVGGICENSIAEDFITGAFIHSKGWKSCYVPEVLAEGLAPEDFLSYYKQQFRWARGSMDVIFRYYPLFFKRGLTFAQRVQYFSSVSFFLSGMVVLMNAAIPLVFFFTGYVPLEISTMALASVFLPFIFLTLYILQVSSHFSFTFKSLAFSMAGFPIHIKAILAALIGKKNGFSVTPKRADGKNGALSLVTPHIAYVALVVVGVVYAYLREGGLNPSLVTNFAWALFNIGVFAEFIRAAMPSDVKETFIARTHINAVNVEEVGVLSVE